MSEVIQLWSPLIQGGFAVFALLLLGALIGAVIIARREVRDDDESEEKA